MESGKIGVRLRVRVRLRLRLGDKIKVEVIDIQFAEVGKGNTMK